MKSNFVKEFNFIGRSCRISMKPGMSHYVSFTDNSSITPTQMGYAFTEEELNREIDRIVDWKIRQYKEDNSGYYRY